MDEQQHQDPDDLPGRHVTINQVVAQNLAYYRRAAGLTQRQLGELVGWSNNNLSEAERSWDGNRVREFDAHTLASFAIHLGVPLIALFLPPGDDGISVRYLFHDREHDADCLGMRDLVQRVVMPDIDADGPAIEAYRDRLRVAVLRYIGGAWDGEVSSWLLPATAAEKQADQAAALRARKQQALEIAADYERAAAALEEGGAP